MIIRRYIYILLVLSALLQFVSCGSHRQALTQQQLATATVEQKFDAMVETYKPWHSISVPVKIDLKSPMRVSMSGRAYMVNDSLVHVSMRVFGFEVALLHATVDSVYFVDKVHKLAVVEGLDKISANAGITLGQLQSLMLGRVFIPGTSSRISHKSKNIVLQNISENGTGWTVTTKSVGRIPYVCVFDIDDDSNQVSSLTVETAGNKKVTCDFGSTVNCDLGMIPQILSFDLTIGHKRLDASLRYTPSSLKIDNDDIPLFIRPGSGYKIIPLVDLMKTLSNSML